MLRINNTVIILLLVLSFTACKSKQWTIVNYSSTKIDLDSSKDQIADQDYQAYLLPIKENIDAQMNVVIGHSAQTMKVNRPESLLSNFSADVFRQTGSEFLGETVNIGIVNIGGLRTEVPQGNVTIGTIYELMPFENELVLLWLKGDKLAELCEVLAQVDGEGVSGIKMGIKEKKAVDILIDGKPLDKEKIYTIATNDFLAAGNDKLLPLADYTKRVDTGLKIRDVFIDYVKEQESMGRKLDARLENRIYYVE